MSFDFTELRAGFGVPDFEVASTTAAEEPVAAGEESQSTNPVFVGGIQTLQIRTQYLQLRNCFSAKFRFF